MKAEICAVVTILILPGCAASRYAMYKPDFSLEQYGADQRDCGQSWFGTGVVGMYVARENARAREQHCMALKGYGVMPKEHSKLYFELACKLRQNEITANEFRTRFHQQTQNRYEKSRLLDSDEVIDTYIRTSPIFACE